MPTQKHDLPKDTVKIELDPAKKYVIVLPQSPWLDAFEAQKMGKEMHQRMAEMGVQCITILMEDPSRIRIIETTPHDPH